MNSDTSITLPIYVSLVTILLNEWIKFKTFTHPNTPLQCYSKILHLRNKPCTSARYQALQELSPHSLSLKSKGKRSSINVGKDVQS